MSTVKIRINGRETEAEAGATILSAARHMGIDIPTLCHHEALLPRGACRMCIVDDRGKYKAACTMPVENGMDIITETPRIQRMREVTLQMLFTARNHYCMYCEMSGDCELQALGYKLGLDHFMFSTYDERYPVDMTHPYILFDHNRCVLCGRCLRACTDLSGHFVLTERSRGVKTLMVADMEAPLGSSSCVACGSCVQVCPTGALIEKRAAYQKNRDRHERIKTFCTMCALGCAIEVHKNTGTGSIIKVHGDWQAGPTHGILCRKGRFAALYEEPARLSAPHLRQGDGTRELSPDEISGLLKDKAPDAKAYVDGTLSNAELSLIKECFGPRVFALRPVRAPLPSTAGVQDILEADIIMVCGLDLDAEFGALGSLVKRRAASGLAALVLAGTREGYWEYLPARRVAVSLLPDVCAELGGRRAVLIYRSLSETVIKILTGEPGLKHLWLPPETNSLGLAALGIDLAPVQGQNLFFFGRDLPALTLPETAFVACFSPYENVLTRRAGLAVPIASQFEHAGSFQNMEGKTIAWQPVLTPRPGAMDIKTLLTDLMREG